MKQPWIRFVFSLVIFQHSNCCKNGTIIEREHFVLYWLSEFNANVIKRYYVWFWYLRYCHNTYLLLWRENSLCFDCQNWFNNVSLFSIIYGWLKQKFHNDVIMWKIWIFGKCLGNNFIPGKIIHITKLLGVPNFFKLYRNIGYLTLTITFHKI